MSLPDAPHANSPGLAANAADITAAIVAAPGAEPRLGSIALPPRTLGTTLVTVVAAPVNPLDLLIASGTFHSARHEAPYVPGSECVDVVVDSDRFPFGSSVYGECRPSPARSGAFATQVLINDENLLSLPAGVDPVQAAAVGNSGTAAYLPFIEIAGLSSERRHRFRPVQRSFYGGGLYGGGFWSWWRKAMAGHNFPGERRETDWMAEVLANPFKDPAPYGARGSIFVRQPRRVHQGLPAAFRHPALFALVVCLPGPTTSATTSV